MKTHFSIVVWMLAASMFLRMVIYFANWQFTGYENIYFLGNPLIMMTGIFMGIRLFKDISTEKTTFLADVKAGMKVAGMYAVLMAAFAYAYYSYIDPDYFTIKLNEQIELVKANGATNQEIAKHRENGSFFLSAYFMSTVILIGFIILGTFYSSLLTFFIRKVRQES